MFNDNKFIIEISHDNKYAWLTILDFKELTKKNIYDKILDLKIKYGIKLTKINDIFIDKCKNKKVLIAEYKEPNNTKNKIVKHINFDTIPKEIEGGRIDYYDLNYIKNVTKGTRLFTYYSTQNSMFGILINGNYFLKESNKIIPSSNLEIKCPMAGKNIVLKLNGTTIEGFSAIDGAVAESKGKFIVTTEIFIDNNLDFHTGNLFSDFCDIVIEKSITNNFKVNIKKDLIVGLNIENSEIKAKNLTVKNQIMKGDKLIYIEDIISTDSILNRKNIYCQNLLSSKVIHNSCIGVKNKATINTIAEGELYVGNELIVNNLGTDSAINTTIVMGVDKFIKDEIEKYSTELSKQRKYNRLMRIERVKLVNIIDKKIAEKKLEKDKDKQNSLLNKIGKLEENRVFLKEDLEREEFNEIKLIKLLSIAKNKDFFNTDATITVTNRLTPGTVIKFGPVNSIRITKIYKACKIFLGNEKEIIINEI